MGLGEDGWIKRRVASAQGGYSRKRDGDEEGEATYGTMDGRMSL